MSRFLSPRFSRLEPYVPGEQPKDRVLLKLNTNESPFPPSPLAQEKAAQALKHLELYPDPQCQALHQAMAEHLGVDSENVLVQHLTYLDSCFACEDKSQRQDRKGRF